MATVPNPKTWATNDSLGASTLNTELRDALNFLLNPPKVRLDVTGPTHNSTGNWLALSAYTEAYDTDAMHSTSVDTSRITIVTAGTYLFTGYVAFATNATGIRGARFFANGVTAYAQQGQPAAAGAGACSVTDVIPCTAGQYVELQAFQSSGGNLVVDFASFTAIWLSK